MTEYGQVTLGDNCTQVGFHCTHTGHKINPKNTKLLTSEDLNIKGRVKEAINFKQQRPSMNLDEGLEIPLVYNCLLGACGHSQSRDSLH